MWSIGRNGEPRDKEDKEDDIWADGVWLIDPLVVRRGDNEKARLGGRGIGRAGAVVGVDCNSGTAYS